MKCGTTWMQHVVYEVLLRGKGNLVGSGTAMYAVSPWIEAIKSVPVEQAPVVGSERPSRIIKTHLPGRAVPLESRGEIRLRRPAPGVLLCQLHRFREHQRRRHGAADAAVRGVVLPA